MYKSLILIAAIILFRIGESYSIVPAAEKISVTTDRDVYIAGDWLYFSLKIAGDSSYKSRFIYVSLVNSTNTQVFKGCLFTNGKSTYGSIHLTDTLSTGIYQLVSFTNYLRNCGPDYFARRDIIVANRFDETYSEIVRMNASQGKDSLHSRESNIREENSGIEIGLESFVLSKRQKGKFNITLAKGYKNGVYSVSIRQMAPITINHAMINNTDKYKPCIYMPEKTGTFLQGSLINKNNKPLAYKRVFLSSEDSVPNLQYVNTDSKGVFRFYLNPFYNGRQVIVTTDSTTKAAITIDNKFNSVNFSDNSKIEIADALPKFLENSQKYLSINLSYNQFFRTERNSISGLKSFRPSILETTLQVVKPSDYIYLPDFIEISRELLPFLKVRQRNNDYVASLLDVDQMVFLNPYIFVDGVLIEHVRQIISFDSKIISKIETLPNARYFGNLYIPGIIGITTTSHEIEKMQWRNSIAKYTVDNILPNSYYSPTPNNNIPANIPFFHQLLYWKPEISVSSDNVFKDEFYASDCTGKFEVVVTGMNDMGNEVVSKKVFNVVP